MKKIKTKSQTASTRSPKKKVRTATSDLNAELINLAKETLAFHKSLSSSEKGRLEEYTRIVKLDVSDVLARIPSSVLNFLQNSYEHDFQHYRAGLKKADFPHRDIEIIESLVRIWSTESTSARKLRLFRQEDRILSNQCRFIRAIPLIQSQSDDHILNLKLYDEEFNILFQCNDLVSHISLLADTLLKTVRDFYKISKENKYLNPTKFADDERDTLQSIEKSLVELKAILGISSKS